MTSLIHGLVKMMSMGGVGGSETERTMQSTSRSSTPEGKGNVVRKLWGGDKLTSLSAVKEWEGHDPPPKLLH